MDLSHYKLGSAPKRKDLIKKFVERLNSDRIKSKYKPLPASFYAVRMSKVPTYDLEKWYRELDCGDFSKFWWARTKTK